MKLTVRRSAVLALALTATLSLAACTKSGSTAGSSSSSSSSDTGTSAAASAGGDTGSAGASAGGGDTGSAGASAGGGGGSGGTIKIGLITKTESNPYFVKLRESAKAAASSQGAEVIALAGKFDGDNEGQVAAIENLVQQGVKGIMITPSSSAVVTAIKAAEAKGILVVALDTQTTPPDAVPATYATNNMQAGVILGKYIKAKIGATEPKIITLDLDPSASVGIQRHNGFLEGMGLPDGTPPQVIGSALTQGDQTKSQQAMENLLQAHPNVNIVYSINEPAGRGAYQALTEKGLQTKVIIASIDGSCSGVQYVKDKKFAATVMQFPKVMAEDGVRDIVKFAKSGTKPTGIIDTGATLITDNPIAGQDSKDSTWGLANCWG